MKISTVRWGAMLLGTMLASVSCAPAKDIPAYWMGDQYAAGSTIYVDGVEVATLLSVRTPSAAVRAAPYLQPCYAPGDTISRGGDSGVSQYVDMPVGEHRVLVVLLSGDSLSCMASIGDSPSFSIWTRCPVLVYPSSEGQLVVWGIPATARVRP